MASPSGAPMLHPAHTFLSPDSLLGFGAGDWIEFTTVLLLLSMMVLWILGRHGAHRLLYKPQTLFLLVAALPIVLRLSLFSRCPVPTPGGADDFSYILLADTLRHFRLAMPPHALPEFFEQVFVLQRPAYSSMYAPGQGLVLALGWLVFGSPWAGVLLSVGAFCGLCYWMLRGWTSPGWALAGGALAAVQFGPLSYWTNSYWGGAVSAAGGCLVFGALPRLRDRPTITARACLGVGLAIQLLTRPFEFCLLSLAVLAYFVVLAPNYLGPKQMRRIALVSSPFLLLSATLMAFQNRQVTGSWTTLPYVLSRYEYGIPSTFTFEPNPTPHQALNDEQDLAFRAQSIIHGATPDTVQSYLGRLVFRLRFTRFFALPTLSLAIVAFVFRLRDLRWAWVLLALAIFALGSNFYPYFFPHYVAAIASLFILMEVVGLETLNKMQIRGRQLPLLPGSLLLMLSFCHFVFWFAVHAWGSAALLSNIGPFESWDFINYGDPQGRIAVEERLADLPGKKLVFVHYAPGHQFQEWVHNAAEIDASPVVIVHDLGPIENERLLTYYPKRTAWLLEPDQQPPRLSPYPVDKPGFQDVR